MDLLTIYGVFIFIMYAHVSYIYFSLFYNGGLFDCSFPVRILSGLCCIFWPVFIILLCGDRLISRLKNSLSTWLGGK